MYRDYFGFKEKPFNITPNPRFVFLSKNHKEAFAHLLYGIDNHAGFIVLTGEVGTGKTTVLRTLLGQLDKPTVRSALILNPRPSAQELLAGQPELGQMLRKRELRQLEQRITVRYHLSAMDFEDTKAYIEHRLEVAGGGRAATFSKGALKKVFASSGGIPRLINIICDRARLVGYTEESREISGRMAARAIGEVREKRRGAISRFAWWVGAAALVAAVGGMYAVPRDALVRNPMPKRAQESRANSVPARQASATPVVIRSELAAADEGESAASAFNALLRLWGLSPLPGPVEVHGSRDLDRLAKERGLYLTRLTWSLDKVLRADSPALLEFDLPGLRGKRYLALIGRDKERLFFAPPLKGCDSISNNDLRELWSGRAFLPWRNHRNIPLLGPGMKGEGVTHLQQLLAGVGVYHEEPTGIFDRETTAAIKTFQAREGITQSGMAGKQTLFFLYRRNSGFSAPRLEIKGGERKG